MSLGELHLFLNIWHPNVSIFSLHLVRKQGALWNHCYNLWPISCGCANGHIPSNHSMTKIHHHWKLCCYHSIIHITNPSTPLLLQWIWYKNISPLRKLQKRTNCFHQWEHNSKSDEKVHVHEKGQIDLYQSKKFHQIEILKK